MQTSLHPSPMSSTAFLMAAAAESRSRGAGRPKIPGRPEPHGRRKRSKHCDAAIRAGQVPTTSSQRPHLGWRRSLLPRPTSGARATTIGRGGPLLLWTGIWKRFHMFPTDDPELERSPDGDWNSLAWSNSRLERKVPITAPTRPSRISSICSPQPDAATSLLELSCLTF
jgi:hypothetical protein